MTVEEDPIVTVRVANLDDVPWLLDELRAFDAFFATRRSLFPDVDVARQQLTTMIRDWERFLFFVALHEQHPIGFIAGTFYNHFFNPKIRVLGELLWWVTVEYRGTSAGARLLNRYIEEGIKRADWLVMTLEAKSPVNPSSLERLGFTLHERSFLLEVGNG